MLITAVNCMCVTLAIQTRTYVGIHEFILVENKNEIRDASVRVVYPFLPLLRKYLHSMYFVNGGSMRPHILTNIYIRIIPPTQHIPSHLIMMYIYLLLPFV